MHTNRRTAVAYVLLLLSAGGCASRSAPRPPVVVNTLAMLPLQEWEPTDSTAPFHVSQLSPSTVGTPPPPVTPTALGMAIGMAIRASRDADRRTLAYALHELDFSAKEVLSKAISVDMERRSLSIDLINDSAVATSVWSDTFNSLPQSHDALLDVQIHGAGFYPDRKLGFVPYISVAARILETRLRPREPVESFGYEVGYSDSGSDLRFFSVPKTF